MLFGTGHLALSKAALVEIDVGRNVSLHPLVDVQNLVALGHIGHAEGIDAPAKLAWSHLLEVDVIEVVPERVKIQMFRQSLSIIIPALPSLSP